MQKNNILLISFNKNKKKTILLEVCLVWHKIFITNIKVKTKRIDK